jgi:hypothetical protein
LQQSKWRAWKSSGISAGVRDAGPAALLLLRPHLQQKQSGARVEGTGSVWVQGGMQDLLLLLLLLWGGRFASRAYQAGRESGRCHE